MKKKQKKEEEDEADQILDAAIAQNRQKRIEEAFSKRRILTGMTDYQNLQGNQEVVEWPQADYVNSIKALTELQLKEIHLFKLAQDDNFGSNIGAQFITTESKSIMIMAKSVKESSAASA